MQIARFPAAFRFGGDTSRWCSRFFQERLSEIARPVLTPNQKPNISEWNDSRLVFCWLGHSTVLIRFFGLNILTDPILFPRIGLHMGIGTIGPKRFVQIPLSMNELPEIHLILISHAHLDHLDIPSLKCFSSTAKVVTSKSTRDLFSSTSLGNITELRWGEHVQVQTQRGEILIEAFEVKHWGARWRHDKTRGYNGYILSRAGRKILFGGDTAFTSSFKNLRSKGPFDLAMMPIGAYVPWIHSHCTPEQAVEMTNDAGASFILPVHHQTFKLSDEPLHEPIERLEESLYREPERIALKSIGETFVLP
jgi:L-ascorbate metabolism protein UlaG (beta-lactamase superfamily)